MRQFTILIPFYRDSDKKYHNPETWEEFEKGLLDIGDGFSTPLNRVRGNWRDSEGKVISDLSREYRVAVSSDLEVRRLRCLAGLACEMFDQQCIYFAETGTAELVEP